MQDVVRMGGHANPAVIEAISHCFDLRYTTIRVYLDEHLPLKIKIVESSILDQNNAIKVGGAWLSEQFKAVVTNQIDVDDLAVAELSDTDGDFCLFGEVGSQEFYFKDASIKQVFEDRFIKPDTSIEVDFTPEDGYDYSGDIGGQWFNYMRREFTRTLIDSFALESAYKIQVRPLLGIPLADRNLAINAWLEDKGLTKGSSLVVHDDGSLLHFMNTDIWTHYISYDNIYIIDPKIAVGFKLRFG